MDHHVRKYHIKLLQIEIVKLYVMNGPEMLKIVIVSAHTNSNSRYYTYLDHILIKDTYVSWTTSGSAGMQVRTWKLQTKL